MRSNRNRRDVNHRPVPEHRGTVKFFDFIRAYGFIEPACGGNDVHFFQDTLVNPRRIPAKGSTVLFAAGPKPGGRYGATAVRVL